jgi:hypothetical protein
VTDQTLCSSINFSVAIGVVYPESRRLFVGIFFLPLNEINIVISGLLPVLSFGGACYDILRLSESLEGEAF